MSNIYDNKDFFEGYMAIRENPYSANDVVETPTLFKMLPEIGGKRVLDLGCGFGVSCKKIVEMGAAEVVGIDLSERMLAVAKRENSHESIEYVKADLDQLRDIVPTLGFFDVVVSSLAVHYVSNFQELISCVGELLLPGGTFVFSQEHPIFTAPQQTANWMADGDGTVTGFMLKDYPKSGIRNVFWIVDGFEKYHRTFSEIMNTLIAAGFVIEEVAEPVPDESDIQADLHLSRCRHVPDYLFVKANKLP